MSGGPAESNNAAIIAGKFNTLFEGNNYSSIIGGCSNILCKSSYSSVIVGGFNNQILNSCDSVIIGGTGLSLNGEHGVAYVPKLKIATASNANSSRLLVWDTDNYVKWRDESSISGGGGGTNKSGRVPGGSFSVNGTASVLFVTSMVDTDYSITVTGEVSRAWSIEDKTISGFTINANASTTFTENVYWQVMTYNNI
jgi:hypothetical protein